jgi:hypothetical protein
MPSAQSRHGHPSDKRRRQISWGLWGRSHPIQLYFNNFHVQRRRIALLNERTDLNSTDGERLSCQTTHLRLQISESRIYIIVIGGRCLSRRLQHMFSRHYRAPQESATALATDTA